MIRVHPAPEPASFDAKVRKPGLSAIAELVGEPPHIKRRGPRRKKKADRREDLKGEDFPPFWTEALDDLCTSYRRICAYLGVHIEFGSGAPSVDHMIPKSVAWNRVYEWDNYRLACALMNSRKNDARIVLDPFEVEDGWFELELVAFQVGARSGLDPAIAGQVEDTIRRMGLNDKECCDARGEYVDAYLCGDIKLEFLARRAPFVARELARQGRLQREDDA